MRQFYIFFMGCALSMSSQVNDTAATRLGHYTLGKVSEYHKDVPVNPARTELSFSVVVSQPEVDYYRQKYKLGLNLNDTVLAMDWDIEAKQWEPHRLPDAGLFKSAGGKASVKKSTITGGRRVIVERKYKIFKWTGDVLVLQDISDPDISRVYTFKKTTK